MNGLTKMEQFTALAMQGLCSAGTASVRGSESDIACQAVRIAELTIERLGMGDLPDDEPARRESKQTGGNYKIGKRDKPGRPPAIHTDAQRLAIADAVAANSGNPRLPAVDRLALAEEIRVSEKTLKKHLDDMADKSECRKPGRPSTYSEEQRALVVAAYDEHGGRISPVDALEALARKLGKSTSTVRIYLEQEAGRIRKGGMRIRNEPPMGAIETNEPTRGGTFTGKRAEPSIFSPKRFNYFLDYNTDNDPNTVLGNRWICRGKSFVLVSQSGIVNSSLALQLAIGWSSGRTDLTFGIPAIKPLRQLIIQPQINDCDTGDVAEGVAQGVAQGAKLTPAERKIANENLFFRRITTLTGESFLRAVEGFVQLHRPDICWIDPLLNFIGDDASKQDVIAKFCVEGLSVIGHRTGTIFGIVHQTVEPLSRDHLTGDVIDAGFSSSMLPVWAREVMVLDYVDGSNGAPTFSLTACKRRLRAGMVTMEEYGSVIPTETIYIRHSSDDNIRWEQCAKPSNGGSKQTGGTYKRCTPA